jgi:photosynthetic reaction center H subunit
MYNAIFSGDFDATALIFSTFVLFFLGLIIYLRREDRREGYPLEDDLSGRLEATGGLLFTAKPKTFILPHGHGTLTKPNALRESQTFSAKRSSASPGSPLEPIGDPLLAGVGPGSYAQRSKTPDLMLSGALKIVPLRVAEDFFIPGADADPRGMSVVGVDRVVAGVVTDVWVDRSEYLIRYLEVALEGGAKSVLVPMTMVVVEKGKKTIRVNAILGAQFANAPTLESPDQITLYEEERVCAYYGGGFLYATPERSEPLI